jgi:hypothetical protein
MQTGYPNTFIQFRRGIKALYEQEQYAEALGQLMAINRYQWLNRIDAFEVAEVMWSDPAYCAEEIVEEWLGQTRVTLV